jgi:L-alanine-DL-glutamate epimerase-like enolase superfamily enzyme
MQYFLKHPLFAEDGYIKLPSLPGLGYEFDQEKIVHSEEIKFLR